MITLDRDIYLVLLGGAIGFLSSIGGSIAKYLLDIRFEEVKRDREKIYEDAKALRKKLLGEDNPEDLRRLLYGKG